MGSGIAAECTNCGDHKDYTFGGGRMFGDLSNNFDLYSVGVRKKISDLESNYTFEETDYSYELFECLHCDTAHTRLTLKILYDDGKIYEPSFRCYECKRGLRLATRAPETYKCRNCGSYSLKESYVYTWD